MEFDYDDVIKYMKNYFDTFNKYAQYPDTVHRMDDYFAPDFNFIPFVATIEPRSGREAFYEVLLSHPSGFEKLIPQDIIFDERRKVVVALIKAEVSDSNTGELLVTKHYFARYPLVLDENNTIKIKELKLFWEVLPPGAMEIDDVFDRDRKK